MVSKKDKIKALMEAAHSYATGSNTEETAKMLEYKIEIILGAPGRLRTRLMFLFDKAGITAGTGIMSVLADNIINSPDLCRKFSQIGKSLSAARQAFKSDKIIDTMHVKDK